MVDMGGREMADFGFASIRPTVGGGEMADFGFASIRPTVGYRGEARRRAHEGEAGMRRQTPPQHIVGRTS